MAIEILRLVDDAHPACAEAPDDGEPAISREFFEHVRSTNRADPWSDSDSLLYLSLNWRSEREIGRGRDKPGDLVLPNLPLFLERHADDGKDGADGVFERQGNRGLGGDGL